MSSSPKPLFDLLNFAHKPNGDYFGIYGKLAYIFGVNTSAAGNVFMPRLDVPAAGVITVGSGERHCRTAILLNSRRMSAASCAKHAAEIVLRLGAFINCMHAWSTESCWREFRDSKSMTKGMCCYLLSGQERSHVDASERLHYRISWIRTMANAQDALAAFDFGYLVECYKQAQLGHAEGLSAWRHQEWSDPAVNLDGYSFVKIAIRMRGEDAEMEFAAALISSMGSPKDCQQHMDRAIAGAKGNALLTENLAGYFGKQTVAQAPATHENK